MPDFWSHHFAAIKADENRKAKKPQNLLWSAEYNHLFTYGAQGPDFFYYINKFKLFSKHRYGNIGNQVHELDTRDLFREMLHFMKNAPSEALMAYISGFISHYILDVHCHPHICLLGPDSASHKRVELDLEAFCLHDYWGYDRSSLDVDAIKCSIGTLQVGYVPLWQHLLPKLYNVSIVESELIQGHFSMLRLQKMLVNDTLNKIPFVSLLSKLFHYDLSSLSFPNVEDLSLKKLRDYESFQHLYIEGIEETTQALIALDSVLKGEMTIEHYIDTFIKFDFLGEA